MTHEEAYDKATKVKWKVVPCISGEDCWCRLVVPEETINYGHDNEVEIIGLSAVSKKMAEYIVLVHNQSINSQRT